MVNFLTMGRVAGLLFFLVSGIGLPGLAQQQSCPDNINFAAGSLASWSATTGLIGGASTNYPSNAGTTRLAEYSINTTGIQVITTSFTDRFGSFPTIPTINGYAYNYSVLLGSTSTSYDLGSRTNRNPGGFTRSITYTINVPAGPASVPYTMTYAYALVLENGTHNSSEQPLFKATLTTSDSIIRCASPEYYLPTFNNAGGSGSGPSTGATLDTAAALANGFTNSPELFLSHAGVNNENGVWLQDVWTKDWTEVTFDLSPYRGQQVTLTFEASNCNPGAHFAYAYVALRNTCAGLEISGNTTVCSNTEQTYSIPALAGASYTWTVPAGWVIRNGANTNTIEVQTGTTGGYIIAQQVNSCANLKDTILVGTTPPTEAGQVNSSNIVCTGNNTTQLTIAGKVGDVVDWIYSTDGTNWTRLGITANDYTAQNLNTTTRYAALVQNGATCRLDTSLLATVTVNPKSAGGTLTPATAHVCLGEVHLPTLEVINNTGTITNWQWSYDSTNWNNMAPAYQQSSYQPGSITTTTFYRTIVQSGVCPPDTGSAVAIRYFNVPTPMGSISPDTSSICFGKPATLSATITTGTSYSWSHPGIMLQAGSGNVPYLPYQFSPTATPASSRDIILSVYNAGCPTVFRDTSYVIVAPRIVVFAGNDTAVVAGQSLQLNATSNLPEANIFNWTPAANLSSTSIYNPVGNYGTNSPESITYIVTASTAAGCSASDNIKVTIFKTGADIFMPTAFSPNGDGRNDIITPICVGIQRLHYFRVYNRWGQLVFSTTQIGQGWDGRISGSTQGSNNFVYMVEGVDFTGRIISKKGNLALIR